jgi:hypothetical protein
MYLCVKLKVGFVFGFLLHTGQCKGFVPRNCTMNAFPSICTVLVPNYFRNSNEDKLSVRIQCITRKSNHIIIKLQPL